MDKVIIIGLVLLLIILAFSIKTQTNNNTFKKTVNCNNLIDKLEECKNRFGLLDLECEEFILRQGSICKLT